MAEETITIYKVDTTESVRNVHDLRENIKKLKQQLDDENLAWEDQQKILKELQVNQAALKNAMYGTAASMEDVAKAAKAENVEFDKNNQLIKDSTVSYNALVKKMADLTQEFRSTGDAARRAELGQQIKSLNTELKRLDADRGIFSRNVGDYFNQIVPGLRNVNQALGIMGKQPVLGLLMLLTPVLTKIVDALKENGTALGAINKLAKALEPVVQFLEGILEKIAGTLAKAVDWILQLGEESGISFKTIVAGAVGVGNALLQFILTPVRTTIEAIKGLGNVVKDVFSGRFKQAGEDAKTALKGIGDAFKKGIDFKGNFESGKAAGDAFIEGLKSTKKKAGEAAKAISEEVEQGLRYSADRILKIMQEGDKARQEQQDAFLADLAASEKETADEIAQIWADYETQRDAELEQERERNETRKTLLAAYASTVSDVMGSIADMMEEDAEHDKKTAQKVKALRTASAIIDTISGAIAAYMSGVKSGLPAPANIALGVAQAATVLAAGMANVKKIQSTKVGDGDGGSSASVPALAMAPAAGPSIQQTRTITGASEVDRLNRMAGDQRVVLVWSDVELKQHQQRVQIRETNF